MKSKRKTTNKISEGEGSPRRKPVRYMMLHRAKRRAQKKNFEFALTLKDIPEIPAICPVLGIEIKQNARCAGDSSPSLDRISSLRGYVVGNIRVISYRANRLKGDSTIAELEKLLADARQYKDF